MRKNLPSNEYISSRHIFGISRTDSSHISVVTSRVSMSKPNTSVVEDPRPVPNSNRPWVRWSNRATVSATRAGWFTLAVMLKIAEPTWMRSVRPATWERNTSGPGMWLYSVRKWCSGHQTYLKPARSAATAMSTLRMMRLCSPIGSWSVSYLGTNSWAKTPNSTGSGSFVGSRPSRHGRGRSAKIETCSNSGRIAPGGQVAGRSGRVVGQLAPPRAALDHLLDHDADAGCVVLLLDDVGLQRVPLPGDDDVLVVPGRHRDALAGLDDLGHVLGL